MRYIWGRWEGEIKHYWLKSSACQYLHFLILHFPLLPSSETIPWSNHQERNLSPAIPGGACWGTEMILWCAMWSLRGVAEELSKTQGEKSLIPTQKQWSGKQKILAINFTWLAKSINLVQKLHCKISCPRDRTVKKKSMSLDGF